MPRIKIARKSTAIDMTAMCDVAFLLLTFFILTAKARQAEPMSVDTPASTTTIVVPQTDIATLIVGHEKVFFGVEGTTIRRQTLEQMGTKYNMQFTEDEKRVFSTVPSFGMPLASLKQFLDMDVDQRKSFKQNGIPTDSVSNELFNWIRESRVATKALENKEERITIKGDAKEEYPTIKKVIDILQKQKVNKFSLITAIRSKPK